MLIRDEGMNETPLDYDGQPIDYYIGEEWRDIPGFYGYEVSSKGRVRSFYKKVHNKTGYGTHNEITNEPHIMSQSDDGNGYLKVMLYDRETGKRKCVKIHRLVAEVFIPNDREDWDTVDHIKSGGYIKDDNRVENLRWISRSDNIRKAYRDGLHDERIYKSKKVVYAINIVTGEEKKYESIKDCANDIGIDRSNISHVLIGDIKYLHGYTFRYGENYDE